ncbi:reverse transcriptase domain-containing protein [Tanacetum coccineum]
MIDVFNKKITLRVGDDEVILDVDQSIKRPPTEDDEFYKIDDLDNTINAEAQKLLENNEPDLFLSRGLEKSIDQSDLEGCEPVECKTKNDSESNEPIRCIASINTPYPVVQGSAKPFEVEREHLYSVSVNEIDEKKPELKDLSHHLEYVYLHGDKSFLIIISSELSEKEKISLLQVLEKRKEAIAWKMSDIKGINPLYCTHNILMEDDFKLVIQPQRRLNMKVQDVVKNEIVKLLDSKLIYPISDSLWVSPIHIVPKKGGMIVVMNDNNELIPSRTVIGWLCNAPATFQRCMTTIFHDMVEEFMEVFMDDFSVFGHKISGAGIEVDRAKIDVIDKLPYPTNVKGVRSFLGHAGFYRRFIKDFSLISKPMTKLLMKDAKFDFSDDCKKAFNILKEKLTTAPIIISPDWNVPFELMCDASDFAVGAVLGQRIDGKFKPIYYASKTLNNAQEHYTKTEKELLVVVFSFDKFRPYLVLSKTIFYTGHSALKFDIEIKDKRGAENLAADHLSRIENPELSTFMEEEIADEFLDEHLMALKTEINNDEPCASVTGRKVYESGFFWPSIFKDAKDYVIRCDACQRSGNISSRSEMPQNNIQDRKTFP